MERKLASIQKISEISPIPNSDNLILLRILGWDVVSNKEAKHQKNDLVVLCEIDSFLPERPEFEFLRASSYKPAFLDRPAGFRIKTVKLRGQVSQGICFPTSILPSGVSVEEGADVTEALGVVKYEVPVPVGMSGKVKGMFPGFLPKTDEVRVQNVEAALIRHQGRLFYVTEKLDGSSFTAFLREGKFGICSRNLLMDETDESTIYSKVAKALDLENVLRKMVERLGYDVAVQGEICGPGVQGNKYGLKTHDLFVFNLLNIGTRGLLDFSEMLALTSEFGLKTVPYLGDYVLVPSVDVLVKYSEGVSRLNPNTKREGVVFRPLVEEWDEDVGGRLSFKAINPQFLLKYDE